MRSKQIVVESKPTGVVLIVLALGCGTTPPPRDLYGDLSRTVVWSRLVSSPDEEEERVDEAIRLHLAGVGGDREAAERGLELLIELNAKRPDAPRIVAYLGSARVLAATRMLAPWSKGRTCNEGLRLLDEAVESAPEDVEVRFVRAVSTFPIPRFFGRARQCAADLEWVGKRCRAAVDAGDLSADIAASALFHLGLVRDRDGDSPGARAAWREAVAVAPRSEPARLAREKLGGAR